MTSDIPSRVSRRTVLKLSAAAIVTVAVPMRPGLASAQTPAPQLLDLAPTSRPSIEVLAPGPTAGLAVPADLGVVMTVEGGVPSGTTIDFVFDPRMYDLLDEPLATAEDGLVAAASESPAVEKATGVITVRVVINQDVAAGRPVTLIMGQLKPRRFPHDVIRDNFGLSASSARPGAGRRAQRSLTAPAGLDVAQQPWGAEVAVLWQEITWSGGAFKYYAPREVSVRSVGPGPLPGGYALRVAIDPSPVAGLSVVGARDGDGRRLPGRSQESRNLAVAGIEWVGQRPVPAGSWAHVQLDLKIRSFEGPLPGVKHPVVELIPAIASRGQRTTFAESVTRQDSVTDLASQEEAAVNR